MCDLYILSHEHQSIHLGGNGLQPTYKTHSAIIQEQTSAEELKS